MRCVFDEVDQEILEKSQAARKAQDALRSWPRLGDIIVYADGTESRVAHVYHDSVQPALWTGSYYVYKTGSMEYSGALTNSIPITDLKEGGYKPAPIWFFHHGQTGAHRGVYANMEVRTWACSLPTAPDRKSR